MPLSSAIPVWLMVSTLGVLAVGLLALCAYLSNARQLERQGLVLRRAMDQLHATLSAIPDLTFEMDENGQYLRHRSGPDQLLVAPASELIGRTVRDMLPPVAADAVMDALGQAKTLGHVTGVRYALWLKGQERWFELSAGRLPGLHQGLAHFVVICHDVSDLVRAQNLVAQHRDQLELAVQERSEALAQALSRAERANHAKTEFLSRMSHELRTPLNAIMGFAQLMQLDHQLSGQTRQQAKEIHGAGKHLLMLINEVLDLARVEAGQLSLNFEPVNVSMALGEARNMMSVLAQTHHIELHQHTPQFTGTVWADAGRLRQILLNLLSNAIKYNQPGGRVKVSASSQASGHIDISVEDTGNGIAPERLADLFQPFNRLGADQLAIEGTGIGLNLSRRLAREMGGDISVSSTPGQGSCFVLRLKTPDAVTTPA